MNGNLKMDNELSRQLAVLLDQPVRDPQKAAQGRLAFLEEAQDLASSLPVAVTEREQPRHIRWMHPLQTIFRTYRKERSPMFGTLGTILLIVSLVLGSGGATVAAAQNSLPDQALYPVKTWSEDVRTDLAHQTQTRLELALEYTNRRAEEMQAMLGEGQIPADAVQTRMQAEIDLALRLAAGQPDREAVQSLAQIRQQLRAHEQAFVNLEPQAGVPGAALLERTRTMLQDRLQLCDQGMQDLDMLRKQLRERDRMNDGKLATSVPASTGAENPWTAGTPTPGSSYGPGPGDGNGGNNPWTTGTPTPGSNYDPGNGNGGNNPWTTGTPTPGSSYGPGPGDGNGGNNPWTTGTPTPGSGYGPGPASGSGQPQNGGGSDMGSGSGSGGCTNCDSGGSGSGNDNGGGSGTGSDGGGAGSGGGNGGGGGGKH